MTAPPPRPHAGTWVLSRTESERFPYHVELLDRAGRQMLAFRAQDRWPGAGKNVFCLREDPESPGELGEELERLPVLAMQRRGVRLSIVLDRPRNKRCDFLFLTRPYKNRPGESHEQIFWQTQASMTQRRPKVVPPALRRRAPLSIAIDNRERYPWRFAGHAIERRHLASGDYALLDGDRVCAIVERKTFENMLGDFGVMPLLQARLMELATHEHNALVIEAPYEDFLNPAKLHHYNPGFCAAAIADLYVTHPRLRVVFCSNRKTANLWTVSFFRAVAQSNRALTGFESR